MDPVTQDFSTSRNAQSILVGSVCWTLPTGNRGLCTTASWKPHNAETFVIRGKDSRAVIETHIEQLMDTMPRNSGEPLDSSTQATETQALPR